MPPEVLTQIIITAGGMVVAFMGGMWGRRNRRAAAEVTISADARAWALQFEERARRAEERADEAEEAATQASARAVQLQYRMQLLERHVERLEAKLREAGINPPTNPLTRHKDGER